MAKRIPSFLRHVGPGVVTGAADDDPSGIATYTQAGAQFGTCMVWTVFLSLPFMIAIQLVTARIGRVTGKGVAASLRDHTPRWFLLCMVLLLVIACITDVQSAAQAVVEAFDWPEGLERQWFEAKRFYAIIALATLVGTALDLPVFVKFNHATIKKSLPSNVGWPTVPKIANAIGAPAPAPSASYAKTPVALL
jgi:Natural resistance-associated macrophage protein